MPPHVPGKSTSARPNGHKRVSFVCHEGIGSAELARQFRKFLAERGRHDIRVTNHALNRFRGNPDAGEELLNHDHLVAVYDDVAQDLRRRGFQRHGVKIHSWQEINRNNDPGWMARLLRIIEGN